MVVQPKQKNPNTNHVSLDLQVLNKAMQHTRHVQAPITEDFVTTFKDCKVFSNLDMNHGYHQFALDKDILKSLGRLAFGGINSQDLFDKNGKIISRITRGLQQQG